MKKRNCSVDDDLREKKAMIVAGCIAVIFIIIAVLVGSCMNVTVNNGKGEAAPSVITVKPSLNKLSREEHDP